MNNNKISNIVMLGYIQEYPIDSNKDGLKIIDQDKEFKILLNDNSWALFSYVDTEVEIHGELITDEDGKKFMKVLSFREIFLDYNDIDNEDLDYDNPDYHYYDPDPLSDLR